MKKYLFAIIAICQESRHFSALTEKGRTVTGMPDKEKVINGLEKLRKDLGYGLPDRSNVVMRYLDSLTDAIALLKEQEPKPPIHIHEEYPEHDWVTDKDGNIDEWAMEYEYHNGPACKRCGYSFCEHCKPNGWNEKPCVVDYYQCPKCRKHIPKYGKNIEHCVHCGQAVKWE